MKKNMNKDMKEKIKKMKRNKYTVRNRRKIRNRERRNRWRNRKN